LRRPTVVAVVVRTNQRDDDHQTERRDHIRAAVFRHFSRGDRYSITADVARRRPVLAAGKET